MTLWRGLVSECLTFAGRTGFGHDLALEEGKIHYFCIYCTKHTVEIVLYAYCMGALYAHKLKCFF